MRDGTIRWNGKKISAETLRSFSSILPEMNPVPFTIVQVENGASCSVAREVRQTINTYAQCVGEYGSRCGEGPEPWARIGDIIGASGETYKYNPDRNETSVRGTTR